MSTVLAPDLRVLSDEALERLAARATAPRQPDLTEDLAELAEAGYLLVAIPVEFGGLGGNLIQVCHQQRQLARRSASLALAVNDHLCWTGTAAELRRSGDRSLVWLLEEAAGGELFSGGCQERFTGLAWTYTTLAAAIATGIGEAAFDAARSAADDTSRPEWRGVAADMMIELEAMSAHTGRVSEDWSAGVDWGAAWPAKLAAARLRAVTGAQRIVEWALQICDRAGRDGERLRRCRADLGAGKRGLEPGDRETIGDWAAGQHPQGIAPQRGQPEA